jgi:hypothetical protein
LGKHIVAGASLRALQGAEERIPPGPTGATLTRTAEPRNPIVSFRVRHIGIIDRLLDNSLEGAIFRFVNAPCIRMRRGFL